MFPVYPCSPKAAQFVSKEPDQFGYLSEDKRSKYPFHLLPLGYSFAVPFDEKVRSSLRLCAWNASKKYGKKFKVLTHRNLGVLEIVRTL